MAETFKNSRLVLANGSQADGYTCPAATTALVKSVIIANTHTAAVSVTVDWIDTSISASTATKLCNAMVIPNNSVLSILPSVLVLEATDKLRFTSSNSSGLLEITTSVLEIS